MNSVLLKALKLKPAAAIQYIKRKGYDVSWNWFDTWKDAHAKAFTVAKAYNADVLRNIRISVEHAIQQGKTFEQFQKELTPLLRDNKDEKQRWWGKVKDGDREVQLGSPERLRTIYKTNLQTAYMAGRYKGQTEAAADMPYWQYIAQVDQKTTDKCREMNGRVFRHDDPIWDYMYPPNHWGCRSRVRALTGRMMERRGLDPESSEGRIVERETTVGRGDAAKTVTVKGIALGNGNTFWAGPGWDYNAGKAAWMPEVEKFHPLDARRFVEEGFKGPDYMRFLEARGKIGGMLPVAVLPEEYMASIGAKTNVVHMSADTLWKNTAHHPDITTAEYLRLQEVIERPQVLAQNAGKTQISAIMDIDGKPYFAVLKSANGGKELFLQSFRRTDDKAIQGLKKDTKQWTILKE